MKHGQKIKIDADVVCPQCYRPAAEGAAMMPAAADRYKRPLRSYLGGCKNCNRKFEVIQFKADKKSRWSIHMYRFFDPEGNERTGPWQTLKPLGDPEAPALTGPGGDFDKEIKIDSVAFLERAHNMLKSMMEAFGNLLKAAKRSKEIDDGKSPF